ncbi:Rubisco activation protein CbbO [uncultured Gammaproteobacteria bacterium]|nr:Rubisco activation protein CbbO [uncultured Gammaproteobacteria bacterium]
MMAHEVDCELAGDDAQVIWTCKDTMRVYEDDLTDNAKSFNETMGKEPISDPFHYQEWDYQIQLHRLIGQPFMNIGHQKVTLKILKIF